MQHCRGRSEGGSTEADVPSMSLILFNNKTLVCNIVGGAWREAAQRQACLPCHLFCLTTKHLCATLQGALGGRQHRGRRAFHVTYSVQQNTCVQHCRGRLEGGSTEADVPSKSLILFNNRTLVRNIAGGAWREAAQRQACPSWRLLGPPSPTRTGGCERKGHL